MTSKEIAEICGVSRGTVDRALNGRPGINPETKKRILEIAQQLGYQPDFLAQSLVKGSSKTIGVVIFDIHNRVFSQMVHALEARAQGLGYSMYLMLTNKDPELEIKYIKQLAARKVDGIALYSVNQGDEFNQMLSNITVPIVAFGNRISKAVPFVWLDDEKAVKDAFHYIQRKGYQRIVYVSPPIRLIGQRNIYSPEKRYLTFRQCMEQHPELDYHIISNPNYIEELKTLFDPKQPQKRTAIFCTSDIYAIQVMELLKQQKISVPEQVGVMGFDNIDTLQFISPRLTTIDYDIDQMGKHVIDLLIRSEQEAATNEVYVQHQILEHETL